MRENVLIFDLDETILSINSFPYWVRYLLAGRFARLGPVARARLSFDTAWVMLRRKAFGLGHLETKRRLQRLWHDALARDPQGVATAGLTGALMAAMRPQLVPLLAGIGRHRAILATAAADEYARALAEKMGFTHILTTPPHHAGAMRENSREEKRDRVLALLGQLGWSEHRRLFFTDHREDLPLILASDHVFWFGTEEKLAAVRDAAPEILITPARALTAEALHRHLDLNEPQA